MTEDDKDRIFWLLFAVAALPVALGVLPALVPAVETFLLEHQVLVSESVLIRIPTLQSGLDLARTAIVGGAVLLAGVGWVGWAKKDRRIAEGKRRD